MIFLADNTTMNLSSLVLRNTGFDEWGFYNVALFFLFIGIGSAFSLPIVSYLGEKRAMIIGSACVFIWVLCYTCPAFLMKYPDSNVFLLNRSFIKALMFISSVIYGFNCGSLWVA